MSLAGMADQVGISKRRAPPSHRAAASCGLDGQQVPDISYLLRPTLTIAPLRAQSLGMSGVFEVSTTT
jgi:hypothetical protein